MLQFLAHAFPGTITNKMSVKKPFKQEFSF